MTLRAPNGVGKSTLVAYAAERLHPGRVYVPSYTTELEFSGTSFHGLSDGRRAMAMLEALGGQPVGDLILIDEWDANLDADNVAITNCRISEWVAAGRTVVETRHRNGGTHRHARTRWLLNTEVPAYTALACQGPRGVLAAD